MVPVDADADANANANAGASVETGNNEPPAPYSGLNIMRQVSAAKDLNDLATILFDPMITTICLGLYAAVPVAQIIIGVYNRDKCQIDSMIPVKFSTCS